jgi:hypothetical protein
MYGVAAPAVLGCTSVLLFAFAAKQEDLPRWLWAGLSFGLWILCWVVLDGGVGLILLGQALLFAAMWVYLVLRARKRERTGIRR